MDVKIGGAVMDILFTVPAVPVAEPRQRHAISKGGFITNYTPAAHPVNQFKAAVGFASKQVYSGPVLDCALSVDIVAVFPRPKSMVKKNKPMNREWKKSKPDIDNIEKSVFDALNGVLWRDDSLVCSGSTMKFIASGEEQPHVEIRVVSL